MYTKIQAELIHSLIHLFRKVIALLTVSLPLSILNWIDIMSFFSSSASNSTPASGTVAAADMQARKEKFMAQVRNELAVTGAQELINVWFNFSFYLSFS